MREERRLEHKRMDIQKPIELLDRDGASLCSGTSDNFSDAGVGACFGGVPELASDVVLRVYWETGSPPIEQPARVMWSDDNAEGSLRVGLSVADLSDGASDHSPLPSPEKKANVAVASSAGGVRETGPLHLALGSPVVMSSGGVAIETVVSDIGDIAEDNTVQVVLEITDPAFLDPAAELPSDGALVEDEDWTPHPVRDAYRTAAKYIGPAAGFMLRWLSASGAMAVRFGRWLRDVVRGVYAKSARK